MDVEILNTHLLAADLLLGSLFAYRWRKYFSLKRQ
jgi:hypothetical protein